MSSTSTPYNIPALLKEIDTTGKSLGRDNRKARQQCLAAARSLCHALETPVESILRMNYAEQAHHATIRIAIELGLFQKLEDGNTSNSELAEKIGADPELTSRLLQHLAAMGTVYEAETDKYLPTPLSNALTQLVYQDAFPTCFDVIGPAFHRLHEYFSHNQYMNPTNPIDSPFQFAHATNCHYFEYLSKNPERLTQFNNHMAGCQEGRPSWMDTNFYSVEENLIKDAQTKQDAYFLVDVGGGKGQDLQDFCQRFPRLPGQLILQDQPGVIGEATNLDPRIKTMEQDFFTAQPIKGARAYYMHRIMHDWPDTKCKEILTQLRSAMTKGYSKLLIQEHVIPAKGAHWLITAQDILMMSVFSARERTEQNLHCLLGSAGFKIANIWEYEPGTESLIEAELI